MKDETDAPLATADCAGSGDTCIIAWNSCGTNKPSGTATKKMCDVTTKHSLKAVCVQKDTGGTNDISCATAGQLKLKGTNQALYTTTTVCPTSDMICLTNAPTDFLFACKEPVDTEAAVTQHIAQCYVGCKGGKNGANACTTTDVPAIKWNFVKDFGAGAACY